MIRKYIPRTGGKKETCTCLVRVSSARRLDHAEHYDTVLILTCLITDKTVSILSKNSPLEHTHVPARVSALFFDTLFLLLFFCLLFVLCVYFFSLIWGGGGCRARF